MDVVYVVAEEPRNEELRYSLRSLKNVPHDKVWIAGHVPEWARVHGVPSPQPNNRNRWENSTSNLQAALAEEVSEHFLFFNDDFFILEPVDGFPPRHLGPIQKQTWPEMAAVDALLKSTGIPAPLNYELHTPMEMVVWRAREALQIVDRTGTHRHKRTVYGNLAAIGGESLADVKVHGLGKTPSGALTSTNSTSWDGVAGKRIREMFPEPSEYEEPR